MPTRKHFGQAEREVKYLAGSHSLAAGRAISLHIERGRGGCGAVANKVWASGKEVTDDSLATAADVPTPACNCRGQREPHAPPTEDVRRT